MTNFSHLWTVDKRLFLFDVTVNEEKLTAGAVVIDRLPKAESYQLRSEKGDSLEIIIPSDLQETKAFLPNQEFEIHVC